MTTTTDMLLEAIERLDAKVSTYHEQTTALVASCHSCQQRVAAHDQTLYHDAGLSDNGDRIGLVAAVLDYRKLLKSLRKYRLAAFSTVLLATLTALGTVVWDLVQRFWWP